MTKNLEVLARKVVDSFRDDLSAEARAAVGRAGFDELERMIREAISEDRAHTAEMVEGLLKRLRTAVDAPEIEL
jgi:hypothetical protein